MTTNHVTDSTRARLIKDIKHDQRGTPATHYILRSDRKLDFLSRESSFNPFHQAPRNQETTERLLTRWLLMRCWGSLIGCVPVCLNSKTFLFYFLLFYFHYDMSYSVLIRFFSPWFTSLSCLLSCFLFVSSENTRRQLVPTCIWFSLEQYILIYLIITVCLTSLLILILDSQLLRDSCWDTANSVCSVLYQVDDDIIDRLPFHTASTIHFPNRAPIRGSRRCVRTSLINYSVHSTE